MIIRRKTRDISKKYVQRKLVFRLRRFAIVLSILAGIIIYDIFISIINPLLVLVGISLGFAIGSFTGRYANVHWHEVTGKVMAKLDRAGIIVLILSICFSLSRRWIFGHWIHGAALPAFSSSIAAGVLTGRMLAIRKQVREILRDKGLLPPK
ncbi:hypothetical protein [Desertivirga arenae]|uniref:hypothetical protein n=1 Tax=Desertivirga arenae TaxID=2810309 RepID=UPI001A963DA2|nr:hypothetical protein [Pedobacter sp. SYSU D00823]